jgi:hypothetical protein
MTDKITKTYEISNKKISESCPIIIRKSEKPYVYTSNNIIVTKPIDLKSYKINIEQDDISDEIVKSDESLHLNENYDEFKDFNKYEIIYNEDDELYNLFKFYINCNNIHCIGMHKHVDTSYDLILDDYKGIFIHCDADINLIKDQKFIFYSQNIKKNKTIHLNNTHPFYVGLSADQLIYYPIYIISCDTKYNVNHFIEIFPFLIKNIIKYEL